MNTAKFLKQLFFIEYLRRELLNVNNNVQDNDSLVKIGDYLFNSMTRRFTLILDCQFRFLNRRFRFLNHPLKLLNHHFKGDPVLNEDDPVDKGRKLNVLCTFNLRPVSTGEETKVKCL